MSIFKWALYAIFILNPRTIVLLLKRKKFAYAVSTAMANPLLVLLFVPVFIKFGWIIGIVSIVTFMGLGFLYNMRLMHNSSEEEYIGEYVEMADEMLQKSVNLCEEAE